MAKSLDDILDEFSDSTSNEVDERKKKEEAARNARMQFKHDAEKAFEEVIKPTVNKILEKFSERKLLAHYGQDVLSIGYTMASRTVSFTVGLGKCKMQITFYDYIDIGFIEADVRIAGSMKELNNTARWKPDKLTSEDIDALVKKNVETMSQHCK